MINCIRTNSENEHFRLLVQELDADLKDRDGDDHVFYAKFNKIDTIQHVIVAYENEVAVGCGAIKQHTSDAIEVKRMYVLVHQRRKGIATAMIQSLEQWASELGYLYCLLETGKRQPEAIALYTKSGYHIIPNFGQYENVGNSVCFKKALL
jgi:GNAT superfamily N-acetyltransferase